VAEGGEQARRGHDASRWLIPGLLLLVVCASFRSLPRAGFVWDDQTNIVENERLREITPSNLAWMFTTLLPGHYQPLTWLSIAVEERLFGLDAGRMHGTSLLLHGINAVLFYVLIGLLLERRKDPRTPPDATAFRLCCAAGALAFAIHPLRVESVAWLSERKDVLCGLFYLLALIAYVRASGSRRYAAWVSASAAFAALSFLEKPWAITLPIVLLVLDVYPLRRSVSIRRLALEKIPFVVPAVAFGTLAYRAQREYGIHVAGHGWLDRTMQAAFGLCFYVSKALLPIGLSPLYLLDSRFQPLAPTNLVAAAVLIAITVLLVAVRRRAPWALAGWACFGVIIAPVSGLTQFGQQIAADRYTYLATLPFSVWIAAGLLLLYDARGKDGITRTVAWLMAFDLLVATHLTYRQSLYWHDGLTLWTRAIDCDAANFVAYHNRGWYQWTSGDAAGALADYDAALAINPGYAEAHRNRGIVNRARGALDLALADFDAAIRLNPYDAEAYYSRANAWAAAGDPARARADYDEALRLRPDHYDARLNRAVLLASLGDVRAATADYDTAIALRPRRFQAYNDRGSLRLDQGDLAGAIADFETALALSPAEGPERQGVERNLGAARAKTQ